MREAGVFNRGSEEGDTRENADGTQSQIGNGIQLRTGCASPLGGFCCDRPFWTGPDCASATDEATAYRVGDSLSCIQASPLQSVIPADGQAWADGQWRSDVTGSHLQVAGGDCFFDLMGLPMRAAQPNGDEEMSLNALEMAKANFATRFQSDTSTGLIRNEAAGSRNIDRLREKAIGEAQTSLNDIRNLHTQHSQASGA